MDEKVTYTISVALGALALILLIVNVSLINGNRHLQIDVTQRQSAITAAANLSQLNQSLVQALAEASIQHNDGDIRDLLAAQGITIKANPAKPAVSAKAPAAATAK